MQTNFEGSIKQMIFWHLLLLGSYKDVEKELSPPGRLTTPPKKSPKISGRAFIIRQFKTPEEIRLMRSVYGRLFILISVYGSPQKREDYLVSKMKLKSKGVKNDDASRNDAKELIKRDSKEKLLYGQNVRSAFPMGDFFVDFSDREHANRSVERFMSLLFGSNELSPTHDEYGMYLAKTASLRSSDLSRQVGAAIFTSNSEVVSLGSNEVPKAGGGTYWPDGVSDARDFQIGFDFNELNRNEIFADLIQRLFEDKLLNDNLAKLPNVSDVIDNLFHDSRDEKYKDSRVMDIIEFGRIIHAEMSAICDAARNGVSTRGATMYVTTFPCYICAKHIVASGISRLLYLEPYPKSYTNQLHSDSIQIDDHTDESKVHFEPFLGVAPHRYRDLFEKGKRKTEGGAALKWKSDPRRPIIDSVIPFYLDAEKYVVSKLAVVVQSEGDKASSQQARGGPQPSRKPRKPRKAPKPREAPLRSEMAAVHGRSITTPRAAPKPR